MQKKLKIALAGLFLTFSAVSCSVGKKGKDRSSTEKSEAKRSKDHLPEKERMEFESWFFKAEREKALGNYVEAVSYYRSALEVDSTSHAVMFELGQLYYMGGDPGTAYAFLSRAIRFQKKNPFYYERFAEVAAAMKKHREAAKAYLDMSGLRPGDPEILFSAANEYIYARDLEAALGIYSQMEKKFGIGEDIVQQKKQIYLLQEKPDKAISEVKKLLALAPYDTRFLMMLAELEQQFGKKEEALRLYNEVLKIDPENGYAHYGLAEYYRSMKNMDKMMEELKLTFRDVRIEARPKLELIFQLLPSVRQEERMGKQLLEMAEIVREAHPHNSTIYAVLGDLYASEADYSRALEYYLQSLEIDPASFSVWRQTCLIYENEGDFRKLLLQSEKGLEYFPDQVLLYYFNANANSRLGNYREAVESCKMGLGLNSSEDEINVLLYTLMGDAWHRLKNNQEAFKAYEEALLLDPANDYVMNNYAYYLSVEKIQLEKAKELSGKSLKLRPGNASYLDTYGWILYQMGNYEEARIYIEQALQKDAGSAEVLEHMGDVLYRLGRKEEAADYWKKAQQLAPSPQLTKKINGQFN
jgi:tetratricopeptide (TPR) repeat protein